MINTDKNPAYGEAIAELKKEGRLPKDTQHRYRWEPGGVVTPQIDTQASADGTTDWTVVVTDTQAAVGLRASSGLRANPNSTRGAMLSGLPWCTQRLPKFLQ